MFSARCVCHLSGFSGEPRIVPCFRRPFNRLRGSGQILQSEVLAHAHDKLVSFVNDHTLIH